MQVVPSTQRESRLPPGSDPIVGIDLGTTNSLVAYCGEGGPRVLGGGASGAIVPSVVRVRPDGTMSAGDGPRRERHLHAGETISSAKRLLGRSVGEVGEFARGFSVPVVAGPRGIAAFAAHGRVITPQEVGAEVLRELKRVAEADPRRDIEAFAETLDTIMAVDVEDARAALAGLRLPADYRAAVQALGRAA